MEEITVVYSYIACHNSSFIVRFDILHALKDVDSCYVQAVA
jgi:hypothetical protein